jgi:hypothetical protein
MWDPSALTEDDIDEMVQSAGQPARQATVQTVTNNL